MTMRAEDAAKLFAKGRKSAAPQKDWERDAPFAAGRPRVASESVDRAAAPLGIAARVMRTLHSRD